MKILVNRTAQEAALPVLIRDVKKYLRVAHNEENELIAKIIGTATQELEQFAQVALLLQTVSVTYLSPSPDPVLRLPIGPSFGDQPPSVELDGVAFTSFDFIAGLRPHIRWHAPYHDLAPSMVKIEYEAGFGSSKADIPADLAQALMDQAALHYDGRSPMDTRSLTMSPHLARIGARYRGVSL
jgi:hypothetical protein